jgi:hypothetical protein
VGPRDGMAFEEEINLLVLPGFQSQAKGPVA